MNINWRIRTRRRLCCVPVHLTRYTRAPKTLDALIVRHHTFHLSTGHYVIFAAFRGSVTRQSVWFLRVGKANTKSHLLSSHAFALLFRCTQNIINLMASRIKSPVIQYGTSNDSGDIDDICIVLLRTRIRSAWIVRYEHRQ